ncbi:MAG: FAD-binding oxidoreductase [Methanomassiliicoccaceae archaeon]|nr:FAD-binding oxidoreductase [Methanomassiliicoccaceae archaeon]
MNSADENRSEGIANAIEALKVAIGNENVKTCDGGCCGADICVTPSSAADVSKTIAIAKKNKVKVVSSNNPSWTIDGTEFAKGGVFIDLSKMNEIIKIDPVAMSVRVGAGCTFKVLAEACSKEGFTLGSYPFDRTSSVGSWVVTNGVGYGTYKYGNSKDNVLNLQAVAEDASVIETGYDEIGYYMSGYNLTQMFAGSEGTLGVVTEATLKLIPKGINRLCAYQFESIDKMQEAIKSIVQHPSIRPRNIAWCAKNKTISLVLDGAKDSVDFEEKSADAIMEKISVFKVEKKVACKVCEAICKPGVSKPAKAIVPVKNWKDLVSACDGLVYGTIADRSTAFVISANEYSLADNTAKFGGRVLGQGSFAWDLSALAEKEEKDLRREVTPEIISALEEVVGKSNITTNGVDLMLYSKDLAPLPKEAGIAFKNLPDVVVRPSSVGQISEIVKIAYKHGIPIIPRGNSSWGLGGCMPTSGGIVIDLSSKMNKVMNINTEEFYVKVGAGCTWKEVLDACTKKGCIVGSYPSSFPSATVGAWIATNGMGIGSYKYGSAKDNVLNMEVVLSDGTVLETGSNSMGSYGAGYNLNQLFSGSEGTLCVFGTVTLRIHPMGIIKPLAYSYETLKDMHETIEKIAQHPNIKPLHIAFSDELHFVNQRRAGIKAPDEKSLLLLTLQGDKAFVERDMAELDSITSQLGGRRVSDDIGAHEWEERCYEFRARKVGVGEIPAEIIVPVSKFGQFTGECYSGFKKMKMEAGGVIGVVVDRNTTMFMPYYFKDDESLLGMTAFAFNFYLGDRATEYGGRTTGFGVFFAWNLDNIHDASTVQYMRAMKTKLDPRDVINPGHLVCGNTRFGIKMSKQLMTIGSNLIQTVKKFLPADSTFKDNKKRFRYNDLEHRKDVDRNHTLGDGTQ